MLGFKANMERIQPDVFVVNHDGHRDAKQQLCLEMGVEYLVLERLPEAGLHVRSSTAIKAGMKQRQ